MSFVKTNYFWAKKLAFQAEILRMDKVGCKHCMDPHGRKLVYMKQSWTQLMKLRETVIWFSLLLRNGVQRPKVAFFLGVEQQCTLEDMMISGYPNSPYLIAVLLAIGTRISIAPAILARIYRDLSLLKEKDCCFSLVWVGWRLWISNYTFTVSVSPNLGLGEVFRIKTKAYSD